MLKFSCMIPIKQTNVICMIIGITPDPNPS